MSSQVSTVSSVARQDRPKTILRRLQDNPDQYQTEAVGMVRDSHRYRGLADFQFANTNNPFLKNVAEHLLPLNCMGYLGSVLELYRANNARS